ncbi:MAG TPA: amidase [Stellaceae bacterium]
MTETDITALDAVALSDVIHRRALSCVEVMGAYLDRIERLNPAVNAIVSLRDRAPLLAEARTHDEQVARGEPLGPLHGFPQAVKDLELTRGIRTTFGSTLFRDFVPDQDSLQVGRLKRAGAIVIGKTNTPEFGLGSHTFNEVFGVTRNAYDQSRSGGGSSGGAGAAVALRMMAVADGSDYAGSLRNPAAWNNIFALRPSPGLVPTDRPEQFLQAPGVLGPMARTVPDLALLLSVQAGADPRAPLSLPGDPQRFRAPLDAAMKGTRIAWCGDFNGQIPFEAGVLDLCVAALPAFADLGCTVEHDAPAFPLDRLWRDFVTLRAWHTASGQAAVARDPARRAQLKPELIWEIERGATLSGQDVADASLGRSDWYHAVNRFFGRYDFLMLPSAQLFAFPAEWRWPREIGGRAMDSYHRWMENNIVITMSGCPALSVPVGFDGRGLAMGMQIVAPIGEEFRLLQLAHAYDQATGWVRKHPPPLAET